MSLSVNKVGEKVQSIRRGGLKSVFYMGFLVVSLSILDFIFGWESPQAIPSFLQPFSGIIMMVQPHLPYIQAVLVFALGYLVINAISGVVYSYMRRATDHPTAATIRTVTRIAGLAVLLSLMASVFNINPAAALTVGSFGGLVVGFATQTILSHVVAGVFILISRPFAYGDIVTVSGQTGVLKEIRLMHLVLETEDGKKEILIPSGTVVTQIIQKMKPSVVPKPVRTLLTLDSLPQSAAEGSRITFAGKLVEAGSRKPVGGKTVRILERDIGRDDLLVSGITADDGSFVAEWTAKQTDRFDNTAEIYAKFEGDDDYQQAESKQYVLAIEDGRKTKEKS